MDDSLDMVFGALADPTRRRILDLVRDGPRTTGHLAGEFPGLSRFAVMKHLGVLESAGLIIAKREGRMRYNYLNAVPLRLMYERWVSAYADRWATGMTELKRRLETDEGEWGRG